MRRIVVSLSVSLDGYMEGPHRDISWHRVDDALHHHVNERLRAMSAFLMGRVTYELMTGYWPTADADPAAPAPVVEFAGIWREMPKYVYSRTLDRVDSNATIVRDVVVEDVRARKQQPGGDLVVGGADLAAAFRAHDLIDEYYLYVNPVILGRGKPLFAQSDTPTDLALVETRAFDNGVVMLRHERVRTDDSG
jgi:dihydrofolate reductase